MKLERIVVGIDFSPGSLEAARWTARHFAPDAELVLTHVIISYSSPRRSCAAVIRAASFW